MDGRIKPVRSFIKQYQKRFHTIRIPHHYAVLSQHIAIVLVIKLRAPTNCGFIISLHIDHLTCMNNQIRQLLPLIPCPAHLIRDLQQDEYIDLYWRDYPSFIKSFKETCKIDQGKYLINGLGSPH